MLFSPLAQQQREGRAAVEHPMLRYRRGVAEAGDPPPTVMDSFHGVARALLALISCAAVVGLGLLVVFAVGFFYEGYRLRREGAPGFVRPEPPARILTPAQRAAEQVALRVRNLNFELDILLHPSDRLIETTINRVHAIVRDGGDAAARIGERAGPAAEAQPVFAVPALQPAVEIVGSPGAERSSLVDAMAGRAYLAINLHGTFLADLRIVANSVDFARPSPGACIVVRSLAIWRPGSPESASAGPPRAGRMCWRDPADATGHTARWVYIR